MKDSAKVNGIFVFNHPCCKMRKKELTKYSELEFLKYLKNPVILLYIESHTSLEI